MILNEQLREEIQSSIYECLAYSKVEGSVTLYEKLIAKYTVIDPQFTEGLPKIAKAYPIGSEPDYRPEIKAIAEKLRMLLISADSSLSLKTQKIMDKINELVREGDAIYDDYYDDDGDYIISDVIEGTRFDK